MLLTSLLVFPSPFSRACVGVTCKHRPVAFSGGVDLGGFLTLPPCARRDVLAPLPLLNYYLLVYRTPLHSIHFVLRDATDAQPRSRIMSCVCCKGSMHKGHCKGIRAPQDPIDRDEYGALPSPEHVAAMAGTPVQRSSHPANWNRRLTYTLGFLMLTQANLLGCAVSGKQVVAERSERQKLEKAYTDVQDAMTRQTEASLAERQKLEKAYTEAKEALTKQTAAAQELDAKLARLKLLSLEKELQKKELNAKLEEAMLEVVRAKAKLRSLETKAETVSALAEGEIALKALRTSVADQENDAKAAKAAELLKASAGELKRENYSGALYLATQAKALIREDEERSKEREKKAMMAGELAFAMPLPLQTVSQTKVKEGPSLDSKALFVVKQGTPFVGYSFKGPWVRVRAEDGRSGWLYYKVVDGR